MQQKVETIFNRFNKNKDDWKQPFNQALFLNYDTAQSVLINNQPVPPAIINGGFTYPSQFCISLNVGEVNDSSYTFDFQGSATAQLHVVFTRYI